MSLNCKEIDKILSELDLIGAQLQKVRAIDYETFSFIFYKPANPVNLLISLKSNIRIHKLSQKVKYLKESHNMVEYIKASLVNGIVTSVTQLNSNRIVQIGIKKDDKELFLLIRLWGGFSNIAVTDSSYTILHIHKKSSKKEELPGRTFNIPPKKDNQKEYKLKEHTEDSYNSFIENYYTDKIDKERIESDASNYELLKKKTIKELNFEIKNLDKKIKNYEQAKTYKLYGELILNNIHLIKTGDTLLKCSNYTTGDSISIELDPSIKAFENSEKYFKKFRKAEKGLGIAKKRREDLKNKVIKIENNEADLNREKIYTKRDVKPTTGLRFNRKGWEILVGRNAKENDFLLRHSVKGNDMWLHIRDFPGGYVFIKARRDKTIPLEILIDAGILALNYSKGKNNGKGDIYYTQVKYLKRVKKGKLGQIIPTKNRNLFVTLDKERLEAIKA